MKFKIIKTGETAVARQGTDSLLAEVNQIMQSFDARQAGIPQEPEPPATDVVIPFTMPVQQQQTDNLSDINEQNFSELELMVRANPALLKNPDVAAIFEKFVGNGSNVPPTELFPQQQPLTPQEAQARANQEAFIKAGNKNPFIGNVFENDVENISNATLPGFLSAHLGVQTAEEKFASNTAKKILELKEAAEQFPVVKEQLQATLDALDNLPKPLSLAVHAALKNEDWKKLVVAPEVDFSKNWEDFSYAEKLHFAKQSFPSVPLAEGVTEIDPIVQSLFALAQGKFDQEKQGLNLKYESIKTSTAKANTDFANSIDAALTELKTKYPSFDKVLLGKIEKTIKQDGILSVFYTPGNKSLRPDAAQRLALALYGDVLIETSTQKAAATGRNEAASQLLGLSQSQGVRTTETLENNQNFKQQLGAAANALSGYTASPY